VRRPRYRLGNHPTGGFRKRVVTFGQKVYVDYGQVMIFISADKGFDMIYNAIVFGFTGLCGIDDGVLICPDVFGLSMSGKLH
jgi:hypothetical protein